MYAIDYADEGDLLLLFALSGGGGGPAPPSLEKLDDFLARLLEGARL